MKVTICSELADSRAPQKSFEDFNLEELEDFLRSKQADTVSTETTHAADVPAPVLLSAIQACTILRESRIENLVNIAKSLFPR